MKRENGNLLHCNSMSQSEKNISRLVRLAGDSNKPGGAFTESLINDALSDLEQSAVGNKQEEKAIIVKLDWRKKVVSCAAMIVVVCIAGFSILISNLVKINSFFAMIVLIGMFVNWLVYIGGLIL
ncbi:MAG: hypothetical protein ACYS0C_00815 [Planctomycetota bacterium]